MDAHNNYTVLPQIIGKGSFGEVFLGINKDTGALVAVKTENKKDNEHHLLKKEHSVIKHAQPPEGQTSRHGIIRSYAYWEDTEKCYLVTNLLGPSIGSLHKICKKSFSLKTTLMLAEQIISVIKYYHEHDIIHKDIKPDNFLIEYYVPQKYIYLIDFGLSKKYMHNGKHIPHNTNARRMGSLRYMSINCHNCVETSRRDDMYSIGYVLIYLFSGELPWQNKDTIRVRKEERHRYVSNYKKKITNAELTQNLSCYDCKAKGSVCSFRTIIKAYFDYLDTLGFTDEISYDHIIKEILTCMKDHGIQYDYQWDWNKFYCCSSGI